MFNVQDALKTHLLCQKKTKQYVFMELEGDLAGKNIIKGPFSPAALERVFSISKETQSYGVKFLVHPEKKLGKFVTFPNLFYGKKVRYDENRVLIREGLVKLSDALESNPWIYPHIPEITLALCQLAILGVGDMHLSNILVDLEKQSIHIIDFADHRKSLVVRPNNTFFYMTKDPAKKKAELWLKYAQPAYESIAKKVSSMKGEHLNYVLEGLEKFKDKAYEVYSPFHSFTPKGFTTDLMKSALQKYIRRNMPKKASMSAFELLRTEMKPIQSNLFNRLAVIAAEDIGPANLPLTLEVIEYVLSGDREAETLYSFILDMCASPKTRLGSHLYRVFIHPEGVKEAKKLGITSDLELKQEQYLNSNFWYKEDDLELKHYLESLYFALSEKKEEDTFIYLRYFLDLTYNRKFSIKPRRRRRKPIILIWEMLSKFQDPKSNLYTCRVISILEKAYFTFSEKRPFLMLAMMIVLYEDRIYFDATENQPLDEEFLSSLKEGKYELELDEFVIDKHTKLGKIKGANRKKFVNEGAIVTPEDEGFRNELYEEIYKK